MKRLISSIVILCSCILLCAHGNGQPGEAKEHRKNAQSDQFVLTGVLQRENGSPATSVNVYIFPYKGGKYFHGICHVQGRFVLCNPSGKSDKKGRFVIKFSRTYLDQHDTREFVLGLYANAAPQPLKDELKAMPILSLDLFQENRKVVDIGHWFKKIVIDEDLMRNAY